MRQRILLIMETIEGRLASGSVELVSFARRLGECAALDPLIVIAGAGIGTVAGELASDTGLDVLLLDDPCYTLPNPHELTRALLPLLEEFQPLYCCLLHTMRGSQVAASLAACAARACITAVEALSLEGDVPVFHRALYNGKIEQRLLAGAAGAAITILPGAFSAERPGPADKPGLLLRRSATPGREYLPTGIDRAETTGPSLNDADVIIAAGRGVGAKENLQLVANTAKVFRNGTVGGSRIVCDLGWLPYACQVGATGKTVTPKLYMACGISGSQQHVVGMKNARLIVAVNSDPDAPIFRYAHIGIVDDMLRFLPVFLDLAEAGPA